MNVFNTFNPFSVEQGLRVDAIARFDLPTLDPLEVKCLGDVLIIEKVLHNQKVRLGLRSAALEVANLHRIESKELGEYARLVRRRLHILEISWTQIDQDLPGGTGCKYSARSHRRGIKAGTLTSQRRSMH